MRTLKGILRERLADPGFKCLYEEECHACHVTVQICAALEQRGLTLDAIAEEFGVASRSLTRLVDAEDCDPKLVCRLADCLGIAPPKTCPHG
jgi:lambda repressor-like predicted transcriptional regulator